MASPTTTNAQRNEACVELNAVSRWFGSVTAVDGLTLQVRNGEFFSLLGPSGCGKTTTLRLIAGFERPDAGSLRIHGNDIGKVPPHRRPVNTVFQSYALFSHMTVFDNVAFGLRERRVRRPDIRRRVAEALELVRLTGYEERGTRQMSGGQQQRVALARAIVNQPAVLLLDEPLGALDLKLRRTMQVELKTLQRKLGMTFLYVTHDQEEALSMSDRIAVMSDGRLAQVGTPEEVYDHPASEYVAGFVGEANLLRGKVISVKDDVVQVRLAGGELAYGRLDGGAALPIGAAACIAVRPERVRLAHPGSAAAGADQPAGLRGKILETLFVGANRKVVVRLKSGPEVAVLVPIGPDGALLRTGEDVSLSWPSSEAVAVAAGQGVAVE